MTGSMTRTLLLVVVLFGCKAAPSPKPSSAVHLFDNLGSYHRAVRTTPEAQRYFDQGLRSIFAFNYDEAKRSFAEAVRLDPKCVACAWGYAHALGPYLNNPVRQEPGAVAAAQRANDLARERGTPLEKQLAAALVTRFAEPPPADRHALNVAYLAAIKPIGEAFPEDAEVQHLFIEALAMSQPIAEGGNWLPDGRPRREQTTVMLATAEAAIARTPDHPGINHLYIHIVEGSRIHRPKGVRAAELLVHAMPGAGHMVHMPSHIFMRVGRLAEAEAMNRKAIEADRVYLAKHNPGGFYPIMIHHNEMVLWAVLVMRGKSEAIQIAKTFAAHADHMLALLPPIIRPLMNDILLGVEPQTLVRFQRWDEILAAKAPSATHVLATAAHHWSRGFALVRRGRIDEALVEHGAIKKLVYPDNPMWAEMRPSIDVMAHQLEGVIAFARGDKPAAIVALEKAVVAEDKLDPNGEPPLWNLPSRHILGPMLLDAGRARDAEAVYRADLEILPETGWGLVGLAAALRAQKSPDADGMRRRFEKAWESADMKITTSTP